MQSTRNAASPSVHTLIIGAGFAGIGMAIALKKAGFGDFLILEKQKDVGGVWRDNTYPGAACDVPSHLYSFSFEPNPNWSRVFAPQAEIHQYLQHFAQKYELLPSIRFGSEVAHMHYHEANAIWIVTLTSGESLQAHFVVTATGQLSRPVYPKIEGIETFKGKVWHSAHWDHNENLQGKRVAVIGTGASAIQFVPSIADKVSALSVFQRSPAYILPRPDGAYANWRKTLFKHLPWTMALHRARIYGQYESRAIGFTRIKALMTALAEWPFQALLHRQVPDASLRAKLTPNYPIGCKRILLSNDYLATMVKPNVSLITEGIRRIKPHGIETTDGQQHFVDAIIYGTGFAATEFLAPMTITGRQGLDLNEAWQRGAQAYLGMTVPGFPNFFMLYGPNTNLGHSSIIYMLESQMAHIIKCMKAMHQAGANTIEVDAQRYAGFNQKVQAALQSTVWQGCKSWYVDANGHNSTNWPSFTFSYRWRTRYASLKAYHFTQTHGGGGGRVTHHPEPAGMLESSTANMLRSLLRLTFKAWVKPPQKVGTQRVIVNALSRLMPSVGGVRIERHDIQGMTAELIESTSATAHQPAHAPTILYLHGGGFCVGSARTHRSLTTRLAASGLSVWVPEYRLAPEHPQPAALDDAWRCYQHLRQRGMPAQHIVLCGDSAGGGLALSLALKLRDAGEPAPAGLMLLSPFLDLRLSGDSIQSAAQRDPMLDVTWLKQAIQWYAPQPTHTHLLAANFQGLPPMLIQVGDEEILASDATRLAERATRQGVACQLEIYAKRWHVFQLQAAFLASAAQAVNRLSHFAIQATQTSMAPQAAHPTQDAPLTNIHTNALVR